MNRRVYNNDRDAIGVVGLRTHIRRQFSGKYAGLYKVDVMEEAKPGGYWFMDAAHGVMDDFGDLVSTGVSS